PSRALLPLSLPAALPISLNVWAGRELTDAGELFRIGGFRGARNDTLSGLGSIVDINDDRLRGIVLSGDPLRQKNAGAAIDLIGVDRKSTRLNSSHVKISY